MIYAKLNIHVLLEFFISERPVAMSVDLLCPLFSKKHLYTAPKKEPAPFPNYISENTALLKAASSEK